MRLNLLYYKILALLTLPNLKVKFFRQLFLPNQQSQFMQKQQPMILKSTFKAKVGIFFGYNGQSFKGMQYQRQTQNTIENIMHKILLEGGFILKSNADQLKKIKWSRAARTDKKVHALCNGISLKLQIGQKFKLNQNTKQINFQKIIKYLNTELPMDIRVFAIKKATKSFDMRHDAMTRVYNYIAPIYLFQPYQKFMEETIPSSQQQAQIIQKLNQLCEKYLGTHNFHNFTKGYKQSDPRCDRYMISMKAQKVQEQVINRYWEEHKDSQIKREQKHQKFVRFTLVGQSFIYHQIRKMIGLLIKICSEQSNGPETIKNAFKRDRVDMFLAPGEGLYLNRMTFQGYNKKHLPFQRVQLNEQQQNRVLRFRQYLQSKILNHEIQNKVFSLWLRNRVQAIYQDQVKSEDAEDEENQSQEKEE